jgi:hypothetical protein
MNFPLCVESDRAPLEALIVSQLEGIRKREKQLQKRYAALLVAPTLDNSQAWAQEVWSLRSRADRLARMMDALDGIYVPTVLPEKNTPLAA